MGLYVKIINDGTGNDQIANYDYKILINDRIIESGRIEHYYRAKSAVQLVKEVALDADIKRLGKILKTLGKK